MSTPSGFVRTSFRSLGLALVLLAGTSRGEDVNRLIAQLEAIAPGYGITPEKKKVVRELQAVGPEVIPPLLSLLESPNADVRKLAGFALRDIEGLTPAHLGALIAAQRREDGFVPLAIARIGTPEAVAFLIEDLLRRRAPHSIVVPALASLGDQVVPSLMEIYHSDEIDWDDDPAGAVERYIAKVEDLGGTLRFVFMQLGESATGAIEPLLEIAENQELLPAKRRRALDAIGAIGRAAVVAEDRLLKLKDNEQGEVADAAKSAIYELHSTGAAKALAEQIAILNRNGETFQLWLPLRELAKCGRDGGLAATNVVEVLRRPLSGRNSEPRPAAARTLGFLGNPASIDPLIAALSDIEDWRIVWCAAESLGRMRAAEAAPALEELAQRHWFPPVQAMAQQALLAIRGGDAMEFPKSESDFEQEFFSYDRAGTGLEELDVDDEDLLRPAMVPQDTSTRSVLTRRSDGRESVDGWPGLRVSDGFLVGIAHGEWGGQILFENAEGDVTEIASINTEAILKAGGVIYAVTGLAHGIENWGTVFKLVPDDAGSWTARPWRVLPGDPHFAGALPDGRLLVSCSYGIVLIAPDGTMQTLTRAEAMKLKP
ncbi:MAG: HEAT repeat domain-containing protein [Chthoniobacteraceae bacterium]